MAQFQFRLQSVVRLRERARDEAAQAYEKGLRALTALEQQLSELHTEHQSQVPIQSASTTGIVNSQTLLESQRYQLHLTRQIEELKAQIRLVQHECEHRRKMLVECEKNIRTLEKLRERQLSEWQANAAKREQITLDQWAGFRYWEKGQTPSANDNASN